MRGTPCSRPSQVRAEQLGAKLGQAALQWFWVTGHKEVSAIGDTAIEQDAAEQLLDEFLESLEALELRIRPYCNSLRTRE
jgi:hypothetical protein